MKARHLAGILAAGALLLHAAPAAASTSCDRVASPTGSDSNPGTAAAPYKSGQKLVGSLAAGQTGCFRAGTTVGAISVTTPNLTLTSYPGERATVQGRLWIEAQATGTTVTDLNLDGKGGATSPTISASNATFRGNDVTDDNTAVCFSIGYTDARPNNVVIENNDIHNCGVLPSGNQNHGIYIVSATNTIIRGNWIHNNVDRGIQLYPDADGTQITGNVIDSNGEGIIFSGEPFNGGYATSDNTLVEYNLITDATIRGNVESYYAPGTGEHPGTGNVVKNNCIHGTTTTNSTYAGGGGIMSPQVGFSASNNLVADPQYVDAANGNYNLRSGSPCASILAGASAGTPGSTSPPPTDSTPPPTSSTSGGTTSGGSTSRSTPTRTGKGKRRTGKGKRKKTRARAKRRARAKSLKRRA